MIPCHGCGTCMTIPLGPFSASTDLFFTRPREREQARTGKWSTNKHLFSNQTVGGNGGYRQQSVFPQMDQETGPRAKKPRELWCNCFHTKRLVLLWGERRRKREGSPSLEGFQWRWFLIHEGLQWPLAPSSHSGAPLCGSVLMSQRAENKVTDVGFALLIDQLWGALLTF